MAQQLRTRTIIANRPEQYPADQWAIFNAPRPIYGHDLWTGDFVSGVFYAAVRVLADDAPQFFSLNQSQDAVLLTYISEDDAFQAGRARLFEVYGDDLEAMEIIDDPKQRGWVVNSQLDFLNGH